jgi:hypothetical protein
MAYSSFSLDSFGLLEREILFGKALWQTGSGAATQGGSNAGAEIGSPLSC